MKYKPLPLPPVPFKCNNDCGLVVPIPSLLSIYPAPNEPVEPTLELILPSAVTEPSIITPLFIFTVSLKYKSPLALMSPSMVNTFVGVDVPIPTLPQTPFESSEPDTTNKAARVVNPSKPKL